MSALAALAIGAPTLVAAAGLKSPAFLALASMVGLAAGATLKPEIDAYQATRAAREGERQAFRRTCLTDASGNPPTVSGIADPSLLGVHPARVPNRFVYESTAYSGTDDGPADHTQHHPPEVVPAYISRDLDPGLRALVTAGGFLLLVGDSTAGKSRSAYEAMLTALSGHLLIAPQSRDGLEPALAVIERSSRWVLWLDELQRFLGTDGLTRVRLARLLRSPGHHLILGTMSGIEHARYADEAFYSEADQTAKELFREASGVIKQATIIRVARMFSDAERVRAHAHTADPRIADAIAHADQYGIAEYLSAGPELLEVWRDAWSAGLRPRGAALVAAAIDCKRAGISQPVPRHFITDLHGTYLAASANTDIRPEPLDEAWKWAVTPRRTTTRLLIPRGKSAGPGAEGAELVEVFDYLVDFARPEDGLRNQVPTRTLQAIIGIADADECGRVGHVAHLTGRLDVALAAHVRALELWRADKAPDDARVLTSRGNRALVQHDLGRLAEAEAEFREVARIRAAVLGERAGETLTSRSNHGLVLHDQGRLAEAEQEHRAVAELRAQVFGESHPHTLNARHNLARVLHDQGRLVEAEDEFRELLQARALVHGPDHPNTQNTRACLARVLYDLGHFQEAEQEHLVELRSRIRLLRSAYSSQGRAAFTQMLEDLGRLEDVETENRAEPAAGPARLSVYHGERLPRILHAPENFAAAYELHHLEFETCAQILGPDHPNTLTSRGSLGRLLRAMGRLDEAYSEHRAVYESRRAVLGPEHPMTLISLGNLALVLLDQGAHAEAEAHLRAKIDACTRVLGADHPNTMISRANLAAALCAKGRLEDAEREYRAVLAQRRRILTPDHPHTLTSQSNLASLLLAMGRPAEAEELHRAVLGARLQLFGHNSPHVLSSRENLAIVLQALGRKQDAISQYLAIRDTLVHQLESEHQDIALVDDTLARLRGGSKAM